jgi:hypothetical protein
LKLLEGLHNVEVRLFVHLFKSMLKILR